MSEEKDQSSQTNKIKAESPISSKYLGFSRKKRANYSDVLADRFETKKEIINIPGMSNDQSQETSVMR